MSLVHRIQIMCMEMESTAPTTGYSTFCQRITHNLGQASFFIKNCMRKMNLVRLSLVAKIWKIVANTEYDFILNLRPTLAHHESGDFAYFCSERCRDQKLFPSVNLINRTLSFDFISWFCCSPGRPDSFSFLLRVLNHGQIKIMCQTGL